ncbi:hypothetical protein BGX26_003637, partial [Mortierella sp. AD094]
MECSNPPHDSHPFFRTPVHIAPLNIAPRSYASSPISPPSIRPSSPIIQRASMTPQSMLEGNVRILCDMVDNILKNNTELNHKPLCIDTNLFGNGKTCEDQDIDPKSPILAFSPRTSSLVQTDISKVDDTVISQLNQDSLLNLFPIPPPRAKSSLSACPKTPKSCVTESSPSSPHLGDALQQPRPRKSSKNRNWVITSGLFLTPPAEDGQKPSFSAALDWDQMKGDRASHFPLTSRHPLSPCTPLLQDHGVKLGQGLERLTDIPAIDACPMSPSITCPSSVSSPTSPHCHMDALSQHLWDIERQMRRPSFLMSSRRTSVLSALFVSNAVTPVAEKCNQQERLFTEPSLSVGSTALPPKGEAIPKESQANDIKQPLKDTLQEMDWRAWHGAWTRRRVKPSPDTPLSPTSSTTRTSYSSFSSSQRCSSDASSAFSSPSTPTFSSWANQRAESTRKNSKLSSPPSPLSGLAFPMKDANPELWESEGLKWGDRFQSLVHNFQSTAGRHSKRLVDILPMNRWSKRSRS